MQETASNADEFLDARAALARQVCEAMRSGIGDDSRFNELAQLVFDHQMRWNVPYANFVRTQNHPKDCANPGDPGEWQRIPAVSTDVFKIPSLPLVCGSFQRARHRFRTSGTTSDTGDARGTHFFHSLDLYEASIELAWRQLELPQFPPCFLAVPPAFSPETSLGHMMGVLERFLPGRGGYFVEANGLMRIGEFIDRFRQSPEQPVLIVGTALAFLHLFEEMHTAKESLTLPAGSHAFETGGYKGSGRALEKPELYAMFERYLGIPDNCVINEYSMTELSSQFYARGLGTPHFGPSWVRVRVVNPETSLEVRVGETGYLQIVDLANIDSVISIQTRDLAIRRGGGGFELLGRDPAALPRGCSRAADELMNSPSNATL